MLLLFLLLIILTVTRSVDKSEISQICVFQNNTTPPKARGSLTIVRRRSRALSHHTLFLGSALPLAHRALDRVSVTHRTCKQKVTKFGAFFLEDTQIILICLKEKREKETCYLYLLLSVSVIESTR